MVPWLEFWFESYSYSFCITLTNPNPNPNTFSTACGPSWTSFYRFRGMVPNLIPWFEIFSLYTKKKDKGIARTQSPTNKNCAPESPTFGVIAAVSPTEVQWKGLTLEEPPHGSRYPLCQVSMLDNVRHYALNSASKPNAKVSDVTREPRP